jgi:hypothetical protein
MPAVDISSMVYAYFFVGLAVAVGIARALHHSIKTIINIALEPICEDLTKIKYQLYNNGGESMKDAIDRIERDAIELKINQAVIKSRIENQ